MYIINTYTECFTWEDFRFMEPSITHTVFYNFHAMLNECSQYFTKRNP